MSGLWFTVGRTGRADAINMLMKMSVLDRSLTWRECPGFLENTFVVQGQATVIQGLKEWLRDVADADRQSELRAIRAERDAWRSARERSRRRWLKIRRVFIVSALFASLISAALVIVKVSA